MRGRQDSGGKRWLFTLHSDQSFLSTPELRDSRIGTHPAQDRDTHAHAHAHTNTLEKSYHEFEDIFHDNERTIISNKNKTNYSTCLTRPFYRSENWYL